MERLLYTTAFVVDGDDDVVQLTIRGLGVVAGRWSRLDLLISALPEEVAGLPIEGMLADLAVARERRIRGLPIRPLMAVPVWARSRELSN